jgi:prepilin-type N-terminal cleavage/methylation domain-containing protein
MIKNHNKGFTLIELLVVVLIIGILTAMALPQYFKAVERSRMSEAEQLLRSISEAQQRKYLQINKFATDYRGLDVAPKGSMNRSFHTKGQNGNGFEVTLSEANAWEAGIGTAIRENKGIQAGKEHADDRMSYQYILRRYYANSTTECEGLDENGKALCADFCGLDSLTGDKCCNADVTTTTGGESPTTTTSRQGACAVPVPLGDIVASN